MQRRDVLKSILGLTLVHGCRAGSSSPDVDPSTDSDGTTSAGDGGSEADGDGDAEEASGDGTSTETTFDYYISPTGSDSSEGTLASPWAITSINSKTATYAGKRVGLLDGTYDLSSLGTHNGESAGPNSILGVAAGSAGSPTVIQSVNPRGAILNLKSGDGARNGAPAIGQNASYSSVYDGYCTIKDIRITGSAMFSISFYGPVNGYSVGQRVEGCELDDNLLPVQDNCPAIYAVAVDGLVVANNKIHDIYLTGSSEGACALLTFGCRNILFEQNTCFNMEVGIYDKHNIGGRTDPNQGMTVRCNYLHDITLAAFHGFDNQYASLVTDGPFLPHTFELNIITDCGSIWYPQISEPPNAPNVWKNNTCVNSGGWAGPCKSASVQQSFYNNIIVRSGSSGETGDVAFSVGGLGIVDYNTYPSAGMNGSTGSPIGTFSGATTWTKYFDLASWRTATGKDSSSGEADPQFDAVESGAGYYKLAAGSPCRSGGARAGRVGGSPAGASVDAGAWAGGGQRGCNF